MSADSAITVPLVDAPALARLALLAPALQESLGSVVDAMSGGGTITSPVLSQMAGALRLIGANRLAGLADEMGRAVDFAVAAGDAASEHVHIRICRLCAALSAYLDEVAAGGNPDTAPLFSVAAGLCNKNVSEPPDPPSQLPRQAHPHLLAAVQPMAQGARAAQPNHDTAAAVTALNELQLDLMQIEHLLELSFSDAGSHANLADVAGLLIRDMELLAAAGYHDIRNLVAAAHGSILQLMAAGSETRGAPQVPQIVFMLAVLSLMVDWLLHTPDGRTTPFVFDAGVALPRLSLRQAEVSVMPPPAMFRDAPLLPAAADTAVVMQDPPEEIDTELLEIFLQEADELLSKIRQALAALNAAPDEEMHFVVLRRAFHTLKGSGRMVGLERFARLAMVLENALGNWDAGVRNSHVALLQRAGTELQDWVTDLHRHGHSERNGRDLLTAIENISEWPQRVAPVVSHSVSIAAAAATGTRSAPLSEDVGTLGISAELHRIYLQETTQLLAGLLRELEACRDDPALYRISAKTLRAVHSVKSSAATVGFGALQAMAEAVEALLQGIDRLSLVPNQAQCETLSQALQTAQSMLLQFSVGVMPEQNQIILRALTAMCGELPQHAAPERARSPPTSMTVLIRNCCRSFSKRDATCCRKSARVCTSCRKIRSRWHYCSACCDPCIPSRAAHAWRVRCGWVSTCTIWKATSRRWSTADA